MAITFSSDTFFITGAHIEATASAATTSSTLVSTGSFSTWNGTGDDFIAFDRVVRIISGTGSGQVRNIGKVVNNDTVDIQEDWTTTPDGTSVFQVAYNIIDLQSVQSSQIIITRTGHHNNNGIGGGFGYLAEIKGHLVIGNDSVQTYFHIGKGSYNFEEPVSSHDGSYPYNNAAQVIRHRNKAVLQFGNKHYGTGIAYNGPSITYSNRNNDYRQRFMNTGNASTSIVNMYGTSFNHIGVQGLKSTTQNGDIVMAWENGTISEVLECRFGEGVTLRPFAADLVISKCTFSNANFAAYKWNTPPEGLTILADAGVTNSGNSDDNGGPQTMKNFTIYAKGGHVAATTSSETNGKGDVSVPKSTLGQTHLVNFTWNRQLVHGAPVLQGLPNGAHVSERYEFDMNVKDSAQANISGALFNLKAIAGNCVNLADNYTGVTDSNGNIAQQTVETTYTDNDSGNQLGSVNWPALPYWWQQSKYGFKLRIRKADKFFTSTPVDFTHPTEDCGKSISLNLSLTDDTNYTADGSLVTGVTLTDNRAAPVSYNGKTFGWTITGDTSVNSGLTAQDIYNWWKYNGSQAGTPSTGTLTAGEIHNLMPSPTETAKGDYYDPNDATHVEDVVTDATTETHGVRIIDQNGNPFPGIVRMQSNDSTYYIPPVTYTLGFSGLQASSEVRIFTAGTTTEIGGIENTSGSFNFNHNGVGTSIDYVIFNVQYQPVRVEGFALTSSNSTIPIQQIFDRQYDNP